MLTRHLESGIPPRTFVGFITAQKIPLAIAGIMGISQCLHQENRGKRKPLPKWDHQVTSHSGV